VTWAPFPELDTHVRDKKLRRGMLAQRALQALAAFKRELTLLPAQTI
jgi:folate-dependent tRNA-U54 methylase TrmFO/GidA